MVETPSQQNLDSRMTSPTAFVVATVMHGSRDAETSNIAAQRFGLARVRMSSQRGIDAPANDQHNRPASAGPG